MSKNPNYTGGERFNKLSKKDGYRSRAAYKLKQINKSHNLIKQNQNILDIGCAPGSWIQVLKELAKGKVAITGIDILPMAKIEGITFLQKDLLEVNDDDLNENFDLVFGRLFGAFSAPLGIVLGTSWGPFWGQVLLFLALGSLLNTLRLPKRRFSGNTSKTNRI